MTKEFVPYDCALALKELGFDEYSMGTFSKDTLVISIPVKRNSDFIGQSDLIVSPLYQQAFRWLFEKRGVRGCMMLEDPIDDVLRANIKLLKEKK
jgi:hypothetical protein